jgi:hypothetical protein
MNKRQKAVYPAAPAPRESTQAIAYKLDVALKGMFHGAARPNELTVVVRGIRLRNPSATLDGAGVLVTLAPGQGAKWVSRRVAEVLLAEIGGGALVALARIARDDVDVMFDRDLDALRGVGGERSAEGSTR